MGIRVTEITKTTGYSFSDVLVFEDSTTVLAIHEHRLFISFDNGFNWEKSDEIPVNILVLEIDENYRNSRAVAKGPAVSYLTEDQGKHWRKLNLPRLSKLDTHPFEKDYLLAQCMICGIRPDGEEMAKMDSYVSNDGGKNFRMIEPRNTEYWDYSLICEFACKSRDSVFSSNKDLVYCFDDGDDVLGEMRRGNFFYTDDFGKSIKSPDQFMNRTVLDFQILDSYILVFTLKDESKLWSTSDLWVSNDGFTFNKAFSPTVLGCPESIVEDGLGRIVIANGSFIMGEEHASPIFISDSSGLQFHLLDVGTEDTLVSSSLKASKTLKGTMWVTLESAAKHRNEKKIKSYSKVSSDYGETWSDVRVIRSPGQRKDLFPCDVDDVENCSLKLSSYLGVESSLNAGILMTIGTVGKDVFWGGKAMTFISRDGGRSWEVTLKYPCSWAFGDGGNIIVAIPSPSFGNNIPEGEFYYSLDEGKTWKKYQLEAPILPLRIISATSDGSGLNFIISGPSQGESLLYIVDFTDAFSEQSYGSKDLET